MLVRLTGAEKFYGARQVLKSVDVAVHAGDKIGVVGPNGSGKSTLLRLLAGSEPLDGGRRDEARDVLIGYLGQHVGFVEADMQLTLEAFLRVALQDVDALAQEMRRLEAAMADPAVQANEEELARTLERYGRVSERFERAGGYEAEARLRMAAFGLGFREEDLARRVGELSGGQRMRAALARLLLRAPDLLLLDEPTNHLDAAAVEWLESFLAEAKQAIVVVSHDRYFLDAVTTETWDVEAGRVTVYPGGYSKAMALKAEALARQRELYERQQEEIQRLEQFIQRYRAGVKARQARGRAKRLERLERIENPEAGRRQGPRIRLGAAPASGREVLRLKEVTKSFGGKPVLRNVTLLVERGQRIGVIGPNGSGKTTLLRLMAGRLAPDAGWVIPGEGVRIGYFAQGQTELDPTATVLDHMLRVRSLTMEEARRHLAAFLFSGDDIYAPVGMLSGGEQSRVALAQLILQRPNLLLLDEPTNHLDIAARTALEAALEDYDGTLVVVSHDRYFLDTVCDQLWIVGDGRVEVFPGTYSEYAEKRGREQAEAGAQAAGDGGRAGAGRGGKAGGRAESPAAGFAHAAARGSSARPGGTEAARLRRQQQLRLVQVEAEIERWEAEKRALEEALADPALYADGERARATVQAHQHALAMIDQLLAEWEQLQEALAAPGNNDQARA